MDGKILQKGNGYYWIIINNEPTPESVYMAWDMAVYEGLYRFPSKEDAVQSLKENMEEMSYDNYD